MVPSVKKLLLPWLQVHVKNMGLTAGPTGGTQVLPVGTIYIGYSSPIGVWAKKLHLRGDRASNRRRAATAALDWMRRKLRKYKLEEVFAAADSGTI